MTIEQRIKSAIRDVHNFPRDGIVFKDVTPLLIDPVLSNDIANEILNQVSDKKIDAVVAVESRGFLYGFLLAQKLQIPFIPVRKKGKLPGDTVEFSYDLEYGSATVEVHRNDIQPGWNILIHDDLLATGGTAAAAAELMLMQKATVAGFAFIIELSFLHGMDKMKKYSDKIVSLVRY